MNARDTAAELAKYLQADIEIAQSSISSASPSKQRRLLIEALRQVVAKHVQGGDVIKLLAIAQTILAGSFSIFDEFEALLKFNELITFSSTHPSGEFKETAAAVASLLLNRVRERLTQLPDSTLSLIRSLFITSISRREKSIISSLIRRIEAAGERANSKRSLKPRKFKVPDLDVPRASKNVREDIQGDWYQDPWGWPEVEWLGVASHKIVERLRGDACGWTIPVDVSKYNGGVRPGILINPLDRVAFQSLADELSIEAAANLPPWVHGWRLPREQPGKGIYASNKGEWRSFSRRVTTLCKEYRFAAHLDIQSFFSSVDTSSLLAQLGRKYQNAAVLDRLEMYFETWHQLQNGSGIPQRSLASSVLAHAVLRPVDAYLNQRSNGGNSKTFLATRWMDDIWIHSNKREDLLSCVTEIESILAQLRLSLNAEKTKIIDSHESSEKVNLYDTYGETDEEEVNPSLEQLLEQAEGAPTFRRGLERWKILHRSDFDRLAQIPSERFEKFNYIAEGLAGVFRNSGQWKRYAEAYLHLARTHVSGENLSIAVWAEMFPNRPDTEVNNIHEFFSQVVVDEQRRLLIPVAAQRLAAWSSNFGFGKLPEVDFLTTLADEEDLFRMRGICFAALSTGFLREKVAAALDQGYDDTFAGFLKERNFAPPSLSPRFQYE